MTANFIPQPDNNKAKILSLQSCIHLNSDFECEILKVAECIGKDCSFYQDKEENEESNKLWRKKMNKLSDERQKDIAYTYFNGKMPWKYESK